VIDVLVAGGGPVGLAAAIEARLAGLTATVVEPREGVIDKACGEGLMPGALPLLARLGVDPDGMPLNGVSYRQGARHADHRFETGPGRGVRRTTLHAALAARAAALGVERVVGKVDAITQDGVGVTAAGIRARWLLGCDGLHSTVRSLIGVELGSPRRGRRFGLNRHYEIAPWNDLIEVHWARRAEVYITPLAPDLVGVAVLGPPRTDPDAAIAELPELAGRLRGAAHGGTLGAGPFRQRASAVGAGRVLLVGDASGYVDAITGEGLRLGFDQARAAVACIVEGRPAGYDRDWRRITREFRVSTRNLVAAATSPLRPAIVPLASALPGLYGSVVERLAR
jgi:flavin-dependent dehydrogenase